MRASGDVADFAMTLAIMPLHTTHCSEQAHLMSDGSRRTFIGLGLSAAAAELIPRTTVPIQETVYLVVYRPGENWLAGQPLEAQPLREHGRYMLSLHHGGTLRHAGRFVDGSGGAAVFAAPDDAAATLVVEKDPAVVSKVFAYDLRRWIWVDWEKL
jgi:uncharacterized protein YciI